ncbi:hypothetical protein K492DRAFT_194178 [Lichtheimia hyalospora FSU 10163]|nr:hypothetical protein K492DRAFT_194178 [Lichtheimia hyalospora FSU 10163]
MIRASFEHSRTMCHFLVLVVQEQMSQHVFTLLFWVEHLEGFPWQLQAVDIKQQ